jgi:putative Holliday junction resolvase
LEVIQVGSRQEGFVAVGRLIEEYQVEKVVVGYPRSLDGTAGAQAERVERYVADLAEVLTVPVLLWDERFSTVSAERLMKEAGLRREKREERGERRVDAVAAAVILQDYLNGAKEQGSNGTKSRS